MFISTPFFHLTQNCDACEAQKYTTAELHELLSIDCKRATYDPTMVSSQYFLTQNKQIEVEGSLLSRGDQVVGGGNGSGQAGAAATPNSRDGTNKDGENKQDDAT